MTTYPIKLIFVTYLIINYGINFEVLNYPSYFESRNFIPLFTPSLFSFPILYKVVDHGH